MFAHVLQRELAFPVKLQAFVKTSSLGGLGGENFKFGRSRGVFPILFSVSVVNV